jgi:hypothetical protein
MAFLLMNLLVDGVSDLCQLRRRGYWPNGWYPPFLLQMPLKGRSKVKEIERGC